MKFNQNKRDHEFKVGLFTLVALVILIGGYIWLMNAMSLQNYQELQLSFEEADRLEIGTGVFIRGFDCGKVKDIALRSNDVLITLLVKSDIVLKEDSRYVITDSDLMGNKIIKITPGKSQENLDYAIIHKGDNSVQMDDIFQQVGKITEGMSEIFSSDNEGILSNIKTVLVQTELTLKKLDKLVEANSSQINSTVKNLEIVSGDLREVIQANKAELVAAGNLVPKLESNLDNLSEILGGLSELLATVQSKPNSLNKLMTEEELYNNLLDATADLDSLLIDIKENPKRYFKLF